MKAWNGWYHVSGSTYGTWLPGDPRGWRSRDHKVHVEGDYKNPPAPGQFERLHERSKRLLHGDPVLLTPRDRQVGGRALVEMLLHQGVELLSLCVGRSHYHFLGRIRDGAVRQRLGRAKKHAWHTLRKQGRQGRVWATRCSVVPIENRNHQLRSFRYILDHAQKGAWTWSFRQGLYWRPGGVFDPETLRDT